MPPHVWAAYLINVDRHMAEVTIMQAQASAYGALSAVAKTQSTRSSWMTAMHRRASPPEDTPHVSTKAVFKARMRAAGFAVVEVPKKD